MLFANLVQTASFPLFVHGGPFANIAHGCNTVEDIKELLFVLPRFTLFAPRLVFGADLGAEVLGHQMQETTSLPPSAVVFGGFVRALRNLTEDIAKADLNQNVEALKGYS